MYASLNSEKSFYFRNGVHRTSYIVHVFKVFIKKRVDLREFDTFIAVTNL
jgi:hypothetical protein